MGKWTLGIDVSRHNGFVDVSKAKQLDVKFIKTRVSIGDYYTDPRFRETRVNCRKDGMPWGGYHVVRGDISYVDNLARMYESLDGDLGDMPLTLDCEVLKGDLWLVTLAMARHIEEKHQWTPELYTAKWVTDRVPMISLLDDINSFPLHVANYRIATAPLMPQGWVEWHMWQFSADGNRLGNTYGVDSADVDLNWFNGDLEAFYSYIDKEDDNTIEEVSFPAKVTMAHLYKAMIAYRDEA